MAGEITFTPTEKDYAEANRDWFLATLARPKAWALMMLPVLFLSALGAFFAYIDGKPEEIETTAIGFALLGLLLILLICLSTYFTFPRRTRRLYRQHKAHQQEWTYRWSQAGLGIETANGRTSYPWADFHRWRDGRTSMLLFLNDQMFFYLPRRLLDDASVRDIAGLVGAAGVPRL